MSFKRRHFAVAAFASFAILLSSCTSGAQSGRTLDQASADAAAIRGVTEASVEMRNYRSGFTSEWGTTVNFTPSPGFEEGSKSAALRELLRIGWSVNEHELTNGVALSVGRTSGVDLVALARESHLPQFASNPRLRYQITFSESDMEQLFGAWPGS
ncbi:MULTISPECIES: hypothetical protein [unclassified Curtobacterium]|jgi:hypothetical protein|uniref:hypothetical protein n=1 Tax=unclassified Curtobacterium TaxID=257496 RepID=UPI001AE7CB70|nr:MULTISPECIES: hypothetical protein [unclassified Curtobacterium]MBP1303086.1 hypothetical protein [Curtobacterium sp. 1310]MCM3504849.1 hypothetical protein [Curtobacterium sp. ODYSSEY 48 V2]MDT0210534.1 hypothetical protein [Curtobacterium sp. BRD11]